MSSSTELLPPEPNELLLGHRAGERGRLPNTPCPGMSPCDPAQTELSAAFAALQGSGLRLVPVIQPDAPSNWGSIP